MTADKIRQAIGRLTDQELQAIAGGAALLLDADRTLQVGSTSAANILYYGKSKEAGLKARLLADAEQLYADYYRTHPLTRQGFDGQARALVTTHGYGAFAAGAGARPERTFFVDQGELLALCRDDPRFRYGTWYELARRDEARGLDHAVTQWLDQGGAYDGYLGMNACRYNC